ncbi:DUF927 domain-containing protein [Mammaliicoccus fleurettii]|uniref:DUF927 domain-containing protein n=1 Tax=Mammaliicoccus fleurettii TaxID=150056 RepID=A0ABS5MLK7_9STAP|nr:DUF927 domain-containing protein [Mammaliicoccus fleurettii]MBL0847001.1 DUF927 domain-containing protein [Mammaliicoccus fleurettii]MBS3671725.1 DUF927 domain-containing protein [Mammaliicoccus fleurettii]MBS3696777.1 DUF927 domain-containing protein [Mammaliicoccus fleurettii]
MPNEIDELINEKKEVLEHDIIPENFKVGDNGWLYKMVEKGRGDEKEIVTVTITSTPPFITRRLKDIESLIISYEMKFKRAGEITTIPVQATEIADSKNIINLANKGLDVDTINRTEMVQFISMFKRLNNIPDESIATRLGHVKGHFIHPLINDDIRLVIHEEGYKQLANAFKTKGSIENYTEMVFKPIKNSPMVMTFVYASLGSILLHDFNVDPFVVDMASKTSTGKTTALRIASSLWGTEKLINEWNTTKVNVERKASIMNSFAVFFDDTRKAPHYQLADIVYHFSGGRSKGRGNVQSVDVEMTWRNILLSTGETSIVEYGNEKAGVSARVITLQDKPFNDDVNIRALYAGIESNYGHLGLAFIEQYSKQKASYKDSFKAYEGIYIDKAGENEVMQRVARYFAVLMVAGEILNDIAGFEHDHYKNVDNAFNRMLATNKTLDKPREMLEGLLEELDASRNSITGAGYGEVYNTELKAIFHKDYLCVLSKPMKDYLGHELRTITKEWEERGYLVTDDDRVQKSVKTNGKKYRGYAISQSVIRDLGFEFRNKKL